MQINAKKLHRELIDAGVPIEGVSATEPPRIDFLPEATEENRELANRILAAHVPDDPLERRHQAYVEAGVTLEAMVEALWEYVVESRSASADSLQTIRQSINERYLTRTT
jgi:hypothetical protein